MEEIDSGLFFLKIVGGILIMIVKLVGMDVECLVDIGFMVILVSEMFYK